MTEQNNISSNARDNEQERKRRAAPVVKILLGVLLAIVVVAIVVIALLIHRYHGMLDYQEISSEDGSLAPEPVEFDHILVVGLDKNDPEDDRLFYYDAYKPLPSMPIGTRVTVESNDRLVSSMKTV